MRIPKKVTICGKTYNVTLNRKTGNSSGHTWPQTIVVGAIKPQTAERRFENYLHEIAELVACEQKTRFEAADDEIAFVMNHKQFSNFVTSVAYAIYPMVK